MTARALYPFALGGYVSSCRFSGERRKELVMRMLSMTIAQDGAGNIVIAHRIPQGQKDQHRQYYCRFCGCPLVLLNKELNTGPRFEHDTGQYPAEKLRKCTFYDGKDRENKQRKRPAKAVWS
jgi:hypothetical protein